jgi:hypothetical protein
MFVTVQHGFVFGIPDETAANVSFGAVASGSLTVPGRGGAPQPRDGPEQRRP